MELPEELLGVLVAALDEVEEVVTVVGVLFAGLAALQDVESAIP